MKARGGISTLAFLLLGCIFTANPDFDGAGTGTGASQSEGATTAGSTGTSRGDTSVMNSTGAETSGGTDTGAVPRCRELDILFAIEHSGGQGLSLDAFAGPVFEVLDARVFGEDSQFGDVHLGVIDGCPRPAALHDTGTTGPCSFSTGKNFMSSSSPELAREYACVIDLPEEGEPGYQGQIDECTEEADDNHQPASTVAAALNPPFVDDHNAGFLRESAVLLVVVQTTEDEEPIPAMMADAIAEQIQASKSDPRRIVFVVIGAATDCVTAYGMARDAEFLNAVKGRFAFDRAIFWDLCFDPIEGGVSAGLDFALAACE